MINAPTQSKLMHTWIILVVVKTVSVTKWSNIWTYRVFNIHTHRDEIPGPAGFARRRVVAGLGFRAWGLGVKAWCLRVKDEG